MGWVETSFVNTREEDNATSYLRAPGGLGSKKRILGTSSVLVHLKIHVIALNLLDGDQIVNLAQNIAATIPASEVSVRVIGEVMYE